MDPYSGVGERDSPQSRLVVGDVGTRGATRVVQYRANGING